MPSYGTPPIHSIANGFGETLENSCHPGKMEYSMDESSQGTNPCLVKAIHSSIIWDWQMWQCFLHHWSSWGKASIKKPPQGWFNHPEFHSLMKAELWLVIWARSSPELWADQTSHPMGPPWFPNWCSGQISSELKSWNCLYICRVPQCLKYKP